ncbi:hypothetical protein [Tritonibacter mobilis]|uniref:hypothetical protein n=1 Tax=Tritonibacter mobilis TaxID=379347 RepID=UPI0039A63241
MHPRDKTAEELLRQIHRIGCGFEAIWPIPSSISENIDVLFVDVNETSPTEIKPLLNKTKGEPPAVIAIIGYERPCRYHKALACDWGDECDTDGETLLV